MTMQKKITTFVNLVFEFDPNLAMS